MLNSGSEEFLRASGVSVEFWWVLRSFWGLWVLGHGVVGVKELGAAIFRFVLLFTWSGFSTLRLLSRPFACLVHPAFSLSHIPHDSSCRSKYRSITTNFLYTHLLNDFRWRESYFSSITLFLDLNQEKELMLAYPIKNISITELSFAIRCRNQQERIQKRSGCLLSLCSSFGFSYTICFLMCISKTCVYLRLSLHFLCHDLSMLRLLCLHLQWTVDFHDVHCFNYIHL